MTALPRISVVLPVRYVKFDWLKASIESVLNQDYANKELIVVNDEATQPIDDLVASYGIAKYVKNDRNRKLPYSLNRGFERADGHFHTWTSADNCMQPGMLSRLAEVLLVDASCDIVFGHSLLIDDQGVVFGDDRQPFRDALIRSRTDPDATRIPSRYTYFGTLGACFLYRGHLWTDLHGYDENRHGSEDYDFWIRAAKTSTIVKLPMSEPPLYAYRVHRNSISEITTGCYDQARLAILWRELKQSPGNPDIYAAYSMYARRLLEARTRKFARRLLRRDA